MTLYDKVTKHLMVGLNAHQCFGVQGRVPPSSISPPPPKKKDKKQTECSKIEWVWINNESRLTVKEDIHPLNTKRRDCARSQTGQCRKYMYLCCIEGWPNSQKNLMFWFIWTWPLFFRVTARLTIPEFVVQPGNVTVKELGALELVCTIKGK